MMVLRAPERLVNGFDVDGVLFLGRESPAFVPASHADVVVTGRSYEEEAETLEYLRNAGIECEVYFNPRPIVEKTRESSGQHKADTLERLRESGVAVDMFFEDDPVQAAVIAERCPWVNLVLLQHDLTVK